MTSFTAASGPLDDTVQALQLVSDATDTMRRLEARALQVDEKVAAAAGLIADNLVEADAWLYGAIERLRELENLIVGRGSGDVREIGR